MVQTIRPTKVWKITVADKLDGYLNNHPLEGTVYEKFKGIIKYDNNARIPWFVDSNTGNDKGTRRWAWLRSSFVDRDCYVQSVFSFGQVSHVNAYENGGVSVGFTLKK